MKPLYYLEFAKSIDSDYNLIQAEKLKWTTPDSKKIAFEDSVLCNVSRLEQQEHFNTYIIRIRQASWFKNLWIRISAGSGGEWVVVKE